MPHHPPGTAAFQCRLQPRYGASLNYALRAVEQQRRVACIDCAK
ncbi:hypothetical protein XCR_0391 [Xanthomonas campestris pv. raphani 756C]|nr:hypothetical protein XCR_0391 [Xanthomonas campestris pv. raphani 756C]